MNENRGTSLPEIEWLCEVSVTYITSSGFDRAGRKTIDSNEWTVHAYIAGYYFQLRNLVCGRFTQVVQESSEAPLRDHISLKGVRGELQESACVTTDLEQCAE